MLRQSVLRRLGAADDIDCTDMLIYGALLVIEG